MISVINNSRANAQGLGERRAWRFHRWTCLDPVGGHQSAITPNARPPDINFFADRGPHRMHNKKGDASGAAFGHLIAPL